ncbi:MAG: 3-hydroxyacyl-ACP dehydratase FabZ [Desulfobacterales bacterium]
MGKIIDIKEIMKLLPHRYPFILVDRVVELIEGDKIIALKNVTINEPFFAGHFPGIPIMPGVLIVEAMAQAGGILFALSQPEEKRGGQVYFMGMDKVKFRKPVVPGDQLFFDVKILNMRSKAVKMSGIATVEGRCVAEAEFIATFGGK